MVGLLVAEVVQVVVEMGEKVMVIISYLVKKKEKKKKMVVYMVACIC